MSEESARRETGGSTAEAGGEGKRQTFFRRLSSTLILWSFVIGAFVLANSWILFGFVAFLVIISLREYFAMLDVEGLRPWRDVVAGMAVLYIGGLFWLGHGYGAGPMAELDAFAIAVMTGLVFVVTLTRKLDGERTMVRIMASLFGFLYLPFLFGFFVKIIYLPGLGEGGEIQGHYYALFLVAVTKFTDMGAYLVGSLIGRHKMIPHISPKKTWEGFAGAFVFSLLASFGLKALLGAQMPLIGWGDAGILAVLLGLTAIVGDLAESVLKRSWKVKDSGKVLPGIGGALDLIDSISFSAPVLYFYLRFIG